MRVIKAYCAGPGYHQHYVNLYKKLAHSCNEKRLSIIFKEKQRKELSIRNLSSTTNIDTLSNKTDRFSSTLELIKRIVPSNGDASFKH